MDKYGLAYLNLDELSAYNGVPADNDKQIMWDNSAGKFVKRDGRRVQELTATGTVTAGIQAVELNHASTIIAATIADAINHEGFFIVKNTSASGTAAHTLTLTSGTFDGTNNVATLNAPNQALVIYFDSAGNGTIVVNVGTVALS